MPKHSQKTIGEEIHNLVSMENFEVHVEGEDTIIEGWLTTEKLNSYNQIVKADGLDLSEYDGQVFFMHDKFKYPVGKAAKKDIKIVKNKGVKGRVTVFKEAGPLLKRNLQEGVLNAFSIGFIPIKEEYDSETEVITFTKWKLRENSIVTKGANSEALFKVVHALEEELKEVNNKTRKVNTMTDKIITFDDFEKERQNREKNEEELKKMYRDIKEKQIQLAEDRISKSEFKSMLDKMADDFKRLQEELEVAKNVASVESERWVFDDYRSLIENYAWLNDESGKRLPDVYQKAYALFQLPVDYEHMKMGYELKNLRNLHDAVLMVDALMRFKDKGRGRYHITKLKLYEDLQKQVARFDKDVANAMSTSTTGYGTEWIPEEMSTEFNELLRKMPALANKFQTWMMPIGGSAKYPFQNGRAVVYKGAEPTVENPTEYRKTKIATGAKTFAPTLFIGALVSSTELDEDSIVPMIEFIRGELATALNEGLESAIINGDDSATHFDNTNTTKYQTYEVETIFKGLRKLGVTQGVVDIENYATSTGVGALEVACFVEMKVQMGVAGVIGSDCLWITGIKGKGATLNALYDAGVYGTVNTITTGVLPDVDGTGVYVSAYFPEDLTSTGIYDTSVDTKHTGVLGVHIPSWRIGQRRGITLEFDKNILTQQHQFVASARWDFGKICADETIPVIYGVNIQHTA